MKILFVGGPKDGKREFFPQIYGNTLNVYSHPAYGNTLNVYSHPAYGSGADTFDRNAAKVGMNIHTYQLKKFRSETGKDYEVAFHSSITNPMEALIKGYHYHRKPNYGRTRRIPKVS